MRAYAVNMFCEPLGLIEQHDQEPVGTQVLIDVTRCGVCHTDLHIQDGYYDLGGGKRLNLADRGIIPPVVMGHEVLGRLVAVGPDAPIDQSGIGKTFLVYPWLGCGTCEFCRRDEENLCAKPTSLGVFRPGGYAEKCLVPHPKYLVDVTGIEPTLAATYACSGITAFSALGKIAIDRATETLLIIGAGGVGLNALGIAMALGFRKIGVVDIEPTKRELAASVGASFTIDPRAPGALSDLQSGGGVAAVLDFVGAGATAEFGIAALRKGGTYVIVGLFGGEITLSLPPIVQRMITVRGSYVGNLKELREFVALAKSGKVPSVPVESVPFDNINEALNRLRAGRVQGRLVIARD